MNIIKSKSFKNGLKLRIQWNGRQSWSVIGTKNGQTLEDRKFTNQDKALDFYEGQAALWSDSMPTIDELNELADIRHKTGDGFKDPNTIPGIKSLLEALADMTPYNMRQQKKIQAHITQLKAKLKDLMAKAKTGDADTGDIRKNRSYKKNHQSEGNNLKKHYDLMQKYIKEGMDKEAASKKAYKELTGDSKQGDADPLAKLKKDLQTAKILGDKKWANEIAVEIAKIEQDTTSDSVLSHIMVGPLGTKLLNMRKASKEKTGDFVLTAIMLAAAGKILIDKYKAAKAKGEDTTELESQIQKAAKQGDAGVGKSEKEKKQPDWKCKSCGQKLYGNVESQDCPSCGTMNRRPKTKDNAMTLADAILNGTAPEYRDAKPKGYTNTIIDLQEKIEKAVANGESLAVIDHLKAKLRKAEANVGDAKTGDENPINRWKKFKGKSMAELKKLEANASGQEKSAIREAMVMEGANEKVKGYGKFAKDEYTGTKDIPTNDELNEQADARYKGTGDVNKFKKGYSAEDLKTLTEKELKDLNDSGVISDKAFHLELMNRGK